MDVLHSASALLAADDGNTPAAAAFFGFMGCASALVFACTFNPHSAANPFDKIGRRRLIRRICGDSNGDLLSDGDP